MESLFEKGIDTWSTSKKEDECWLIDASPKEESIDHIAALNQDKVSLAIAHLFVWRHLDFVP